MNFYQEWLERFNRPLVEINLKNVSVHLNARLLILKHWQLILNQQKSLLKADGFYKFPVDIPAYRGKLIALTVKN